MSAPRADDVFAALAPLLRTLCRDELPALTTDTLLLDIPGLDSLHLLQALATLEEHFVIEIDAAALDGLVSVGDLVAALVEGQPARRP